jgi:hypothetical protein
VAGNTAVSRWAGLYGPVCAVSWRAKASDFLWVKRGHTNSALPEATAWQVTLARRRWVRVVGRRGTPAWRCSYVYIHDLPCFS